MRLYQVVCGEKIENSVAGMLFLQIASGFPEAGRFSYSLFNFQITKRYIKPLQL